MCHKIKAALIDMDGVLYDSMPNHARAWVRLMDLVNIKADEEEFFRYEGCTGAYVINLMMLRNFGREATDREKKEYYRMKTEFFSEQPSVPVMPGAQDLVERLKSVGIETILVTGSGQNSLLKRLEKDFPNSFSFDKRVTSANVTHGKPHPEPYLKGLELAGVKACEAIAIDNAPLGVKSAHSAGVFTIGVSTGPISEEELMQNGADITFESMEVCANNILEIIKEIENK